MSGPRRVAVQRIAGAVALAWGCWLLWRSVSEVRETFEIIRVLDFRVYTDAVRDYWTNGADPYAGRYTEVGLPFIYPPFSLVMIAPFAALSFDLGAPAWLAASYVATFVVSGALVRQVLRDRGLHWEPLLAVGVAAALGGAALRLEPFTETLSFGQINILLMAMVVVDVFLVPAKARGVLTGAAVAIKLTPLIFVIYFLWRRDLWSIVRLVASAVLCSVIALALFPGPSWSYLGSGSVSSTSGLPAGFIGNQSLRAMTARIFTSTTTATVAYVILAVLVLAVLALTLWRLDPWRYPAIGLSLVAVAGLLISPISWSHHWVWVLPLCAASLLELPRLWLLAGAAAGMAWTMHLPDFWRLKLPEGQPIPGDWDRYVVANTYVWLGLGVLAAGLATAYLFTGRSPGRAPAAQVQRLVR